MKPSEFAEIANASENIVAFLSGMRTRLVNEGWSEQGAEAAIVAILSRESEGTA